jgi:hypothetical protein
MRSISTTLTISSIDFGLIPDIYLNVVQHASFGMGLLILLFALTELFSYEECVG